MLQNATHSEKGLSEKQRAALPHLALAGSVSEGARRAGIARATFYRWLSDPAFRQNLATLREEVEELTRDRVRNMVAKALQVMEESLDDESGATRLRASIATLDVVRKLLYDRDAERRLDWLEDSLALKENPRW